MRALIAKVLLIGVVSAITLGAQSGPSYAGRLSADLETRLLQASPDEFLPVMIRVAGGVPGGALKRQMAAQFRSRAERHRAAVESLQWTARTTQAPVLQALSSPAFDGRVKDVRDFWIDNVITAQMTPTAAAEIASRIDVEEVYFLPPIEFYKSLSTPDLVNGIHRQGPPRGLPRHRRGRRSYLPQG
jgi:hypothetical protein